MYSMHNKIPIPYGTEWGFPPMMDFATSDKITRITLPLREVFLKLHYWFFRIRLRIL